MSSLPLPGGSFVKPLLSNHSRSEQAMASSPATHSFLYEADDFTFEERSSVYDLQLKRLRENGKAAMLGLNTGPSAKKTYKKVTELWEKQEASSSSSEEERTNFLEQLLHEQMSKSSTEKTKALLHRLIFLAKISPDLADKRDLAEYWEQLFASLQRYYYQSETVTGLLLLYPTCIVHVLESSSDVLYSVLRDLRDMEQQKRVLVQDAKILVMSHNLPSRLFQQWNYKVLSMTQMHLVYDTPKESVETIISECLAALLKLGQHLLKYPKSPKNLPDTLLEKVTELIVPQDTISHLLRCQELLNPAQYLQMYDSPVNILMDSESVWPSPEWLKRYF